MLTNLGPAIPVPNLFVGGRYGILDELDISAAYNLTAPIIPGIALDLILSEHWVPIQPGLGFQSSTPDKGWSLATGFSLHGLSDFKTGFVAIPVFDVATGWRHRWFNPFVGVSLGLNFYRPFGETNVAQLNPYAGIDFILSEHASLSVRVTFFDVVYNYYGSQVEWVYLRDDEAEEKKYGLVGLSIGFSWDFVSTDSAPTKQEAVTTTVNPDAGVSSVAGEPSSGEEE